jgi:hypothetical protein
MRTLRHLNQHLNQQLTQFVAKQPALQNISRAVASQPETDVCARCGASPRSLMPLALMCAVCRASFGDQTWRAPITLRP